MKQQRQTTVLAKRSPGRPKSGDISGEDLKKLLRSSAKMIYAAEGYSGVTVAKIATLSGVSRPTFYRLYNNVHQLMDELIGDLKLELKQRITYTVNQSASLDEVVENSIATYLAWGDNVGPAVGSIYRELHDPNSPASVHCAKAVKDLALVYQQRVQQLAGVTTDILVYEAMLMVIEHMAHSLFWPTKASQVEIEQRRHVIRHLLKSVVSINSI